jgi:hypothetical protein
MTKRRVWHFVVLTLVQLDNVLKIEKKKDAKTKRKNVGNYL